MKRLITLTLSAVLLCPMWGSAQTTTTPSIHGQLHFSGLLNVDPHYSSLIMMNSTNNPACNQITDLRFNIQTPNNLTPIKGVTGYFSCSGGVWGPFSGALVGTYNNFPNTAVGVAATSYTGTFTFGLTQMTCSFDPNLLQGNCELFTVISDYIPPLGPVSLPWGIGGGTFTYTSAP